VLDVGGPQSRGTAIDTRSRPGLVGVMSDPLVDIGALQANLRVRAGAVHMKADLQFLIEQKLHVGMGLNQLAEAVHHLREAVEASSIHPAERAETA
jgi:hypothetical protein